ncbi:undecaprenyl-diphosphate phosphatase [Compostibacter hankyongensis]|uniref:Undecaprenyl-diphosphatase n=1 Tax=Compostibacter hankyongensis TaxID=1007089 RepID=A0ABP8FG55_9BACT
MDIIQAVILAIIEGITEFLPISSTGHLIIGSSWMGIERQDFTKLFEVAIQLGAILAVVVLYWRRFFDRNRLNFYIKLIIAVIPALIVGYLFADRIDQLLESPVTVGATLLLGGIVLLFVDNWFKQPVVREEQQLDIFKALRIGFWQCIAMIPGVSRSAATIIGGMQQKLTRSFAAEFSFFLAVPTMVAATGYKLLKAWKTTPEILTDRHNLLLLVVGNAVAFVVAMIAIRTFITYLQKHGFRMFGYYRILVGIVILIMVWKGMLV